MDEMGERFAETSQALNVLQGIQCLYDREMWEINSPEFAKLRHISLHLSACVGKLAGFIEPIDHSMYRENNVEPLSEQKADLEPIVADLVIYALQIANLAQGEVGEMLRNRYRQNGMRFAPESQFAAL